MEKVLFVCFLALAVGFGVSTADDIVKPPVTDDKPTPSTAINNTTTNKTADASLLPPVNNKTDKPNISPSTLPSPAEPKPKVTVITTTLAPIVIPTTVITDEPTHTENNGTEAGDKKNTTKAAVTTSSTTTELPTKSTDNAKPADVAKTVVTQSSFHSPSFIGGIILTLGLLAIGFMGLKYYRAQTERNYHTI